MLDIARAITDKHSTDTMEKVDILSALAEISLERGSVSFSFHLVMSHFLINDGLLNNAEDIESSLSDYKKALSILERLVEPDSRHIAELYPFLYCLLFFFCALCCMNLT